MTTNGNGITVDQTTYTVTVNVSDNGNGTLKVEPSENYNKLNFVNTYTAEGELVLEGQKTLTGRNMTKDDKFTFEVIENQDGKDVTVATGTNNGTETITFEKIKYTLDDVGEHTYTVKETSTNGDGITVDQTTYTVTANVSDNGDGTLKVEASNNSKTLNFVNKYNAIGGITFTGTKTLDGRELTENDVFTFEVKDEKGTTWVAKNDSDGKINYPVISYTLEDVGEHTYTVKETSTNENGITVDTTEYKVIVNVSDNGKGALNIEITGDNNTKLDFVNIYTATGNITFKGNKKIDTRELTENDVFTFEIKEGDKVIATVSNDATGNISYPTINYELKDVGEHIYTIYETSKEGKGITPDTKTYTVKVDVSDNGKGKLNTDITGDNYQELNFVNKYEAEGEITFEGEKLINGRQMTINDNYTFMVKEDDNTVATGTNNGTETITFEKIKYSLDDVGTHTYIVSESDDEAEKLAENGITLDSNTYTVTVKVSDNKDGTLKVESSDNSTKLNFVNTYKANGNAEFVVTKALDGEELKADQFKFELKDSEGNTLKTATNDAEGNIKFEAIEYTEQNVGNTYSYTIKEIDDGADGYVYDEMIVEITVNVADNGDGTLKIDTNYSEDTEFNNKYETVEVSVQKIWDDNNNQDGVRPESIEVTLAGNGNNIETVELSEANNWTYTWKELVKHSNKTDIKYTVEEAELDGYVATIETDVDSSSGDVTTVITNTHEIEKVDVKAIKIWDDANNYDNYRPDSINVQLYANGNAYGDEITLNDSNNWSYTWEGLDKNESGEEIEYTVEETAVPDKYEVEYSVDEDGTLVITNKQIPGEGGYEEPPAEPIEPPAKPAEPVVIYEGDNPGTGTTIFDSFGLYFALILAAITLVFFETRKFYKNKI